MNSTLHVQLYPSLVRQQGVRDIRDNILFLFFVSCAGSAGRIWDAFTAGLGMGIYTRFFIFWVCEQTILAFTIYYRMDFDILFGEFKILPMAFLRYIDNGA